MGSKMTLDDIKDKVPSSVRLIPDDDTNSTDVIVDGTYVGFMYITPEGVYLRTYLGMANCDDYIKLSKFLSYFKYDLLISCKWSRHSYRIYRLSK